MSAAQLANPPANKRPANCQPLRGHFAIGDGQLKNHIRCVALSRDNQRYLFTAVEEAWCVDSA